MTLAELQTLLEYHYWARDRVLDAAAALTPEQFTRNLGSSFKSVRDTLAHIYAAEWAWCSRWNGHSPPALLAADLFPDVSTLREKWRELETSVHAVLDRMGQQGLDQVIAYTMINGDARS
ncbi:MAG: damage-inducible protein DinB, partial [Blastocatellia bacterium]